ncbi:MAG: thiamine pyrophosphate-binding protein [Chloroflexota bacterium]|nr:thiamine pyrophosphate-binding protein [Chloroflexota bacterium]
MSKQTAADVLIETLMDWGVEVIFGMPGDGINGIMESLRTRQDKVRFVQVRHEESAAFMAVGYAKFKGKLGVCLATSGPGGIHLLNGLYDAKLDGAPVLAITGHHYHDLIDTFAQQDINLDRVFADVALYSTRVMGPTHVRNVTDLACRTALSYRGVAHINFPIDTQSMPVEENQASKRNVPNHTSDYFARGAALPAQADLQRAADVLNAGKKIAILAGRGALGANEELEQLAELLGAPIIKPLLGKAAVPDDSPYTTGGIGVLGTKPSQEAIEQCDTLLMVGTSFPYIEYYPKPGEARGVQIDLDPQRIGLRYPVEVGLVGDGCRTLQMLLPLLKRNENRKFLEEAQTATREWWQLMEEHGTQRTLPMKPQVVAWELGKHLEPNAMISCDSGTVTVWWARQVKAHMGQTFAVSGTLASMANGLSYAIAAQIAHPDRQSVAFVGDGGFSMLMAEFITAVKYKLPIKVVILKNNTLGMIKMEQIMMLGNPEYGCELEPIDFVAFAHACGATGFRIEDPATCGDIMQQAFATPGPVIIEAVTDPNELPMPPKLTAEEMANVSEALAKGQPDAAKIARVVAKAKVRSMT